MTNSDRQHFDEYRLQTRVKHEILRAYLGPYLHIAKNQHRVLRYIDGFAGRGHYGPEGNRSPGSPVLILEFLASQPDLSSRVHTHFIEQDSVLFESLSHAVSEVIVDHPGLIKPDLRKGTFAKELAAIQRMLSETRQELGATFLFVDPCGVAGVDLQAAAEVVSKHFCELFLFFNSNGLNRVLGALEHPGNAAVVASVYGAPESAQKLAESLASTPTPVAREQLILSEFRRRVREVTGADYFLPFRIESEGKRVTSHYLIHVTKHARGFAIMKDVMLETLPKRIPSSGQMALHQASAGFESSLIDVFSHQDLRTKVLQRLGASILSVREVVAGCESPDDQDSQKAWKQAVIVLEQQGALQVFRDAACQVPAPAKRRQMRNGATTLGDDYFVRACK